MHRNSVVSGFSLLIAFLLTACASYTPILVRLDPTGPNVSKEVKGDLTLYVEEYATSEKAKQAFDTDLAGEGVLPLLLLVQNNGPHAYEVNTSAVGASAFHTSKVNKRIVQDFTAKAFPDGVLQPNQERSGFLFFEVKGRHDLSGLSLEITARNVVTGDRVMIAVPLPPAVVTFPPGEQTSSQEEGKWNPTRYR